MWRMVETCVPRGFRGKTGETVVILFANHYVLKV